jgi:hypothetical protein
MVQERLDHVTMAIFNSSDERGQTVLVFKREEHGHGESVGKRR